MAANKVVVVDARVATPEEIRLRDTFDQWETESLANLEAGARQIIQLVSALLGVLLGALALGDEKFAAALQTPLVIALAGAVLLTWLAALLSALAAVIPGELLTRRASLDDMRSGLQSLLAQKRARLYAAAVAFGGGVVAFAALVFTLLVIR